MGPARAHNAAFHEPFHSPVRSHSFDPPRQCTGGMGGSPFGNSPLVRAEQFSVDCPLCSDLKADLAELSFGLRLVPLRYTGVMPACLSAFCFGGSMLGLYYGLLSRVDVLDATEW